VITCEACGREFRAHRGLDCPWCGYNNGPGDLPRTEKSVRRIERRRDREARRLRREDE
jgi:rRNA maturation endonuclease Nob1